MSVPVFADEKAAKEYVEQAAQAIESNDNDTAKSKLELAEAELEGVTGGGKAPIAGRIEELKAKINRATLSADKAKYKRQLDRVMKDAEDSIGNLVTWSGAESAANELFANEDAKAALGDELVAAQKKFATFKKLNTKKAEVQLSEQAEANVKELESAWAEKKPAILQAESPNAKDGAIEDMDRAITSARRSLSQFGPKSDAKLAFEKRIDKVAAEYTKIALADKVKEKAEALTRAWDSYKDDFAGWEAEGEALTLAKYASEQNDKTSALNCPKSRELISRANQWLDNRKDDEEFQKLQSAPEIKAIYDKILGDRTKAWAKIEKNAKAILAEAEAKKPLDQNTLDAVSRFTDSLKNNLEGSEAVAVLTARAEKLTKGAADAAAAKDAGTAAFYKEATAKAAADWPGLKEGYTVVDDFDPNRAGDFKGKLIRIETDNLMGYRFKTGDFPFATTLNGVPVAAKYDPAVAVAIKAVEDKLGRSLGDSDDDGKWEIIARVTGQTGKLTKRVQVEGEIKDTAGNTATVTGERAETVDAPIITIVAAHVGPLAVAKK
ncbi:MAG: hypothetical protein QM754_13695 [Tepidisphaeraceae bacterium]